MSASGVKESVAIVFRRSLRLRATVVLYNGPVVYVVEAALCVKETEALTTSWEKKRCAR